MDFVTTLNIFILLCAVGLIAASWRVAPPAQRNYRLMGLAFILIGGADFLKPMSMGVAIAVELLGYVVMVTMVFRSGYPDASAKTPS